MLSRFEEINVKKSEDLDILLKNVTNQDQPKNFNIVVDEDEFKTIKALIAFAKTNVIRKRLHQQKYTILITKDKTCFLIGDGKKRNLINLDYIRNAFLGEGITARVKAVAKLIKVKDGYRISIGDYVVKIFNEGISNSEIVKEAAFIKKIYGYSEVVEDDKKFYLIMPFIPGKPLDEIEYKRYTLEQLANLIIAICKALTQLHKNNIVHNDIHAGNLLYDMQTGIARFIDFTASSDCSPISKDHKEFQKLIIAIIQTYIEELKFERTDVIKRQIDKLLKTYLAHYLVSEDDVLTELNAKLLKIFDQNCDLASLLKGTDLTELQGDFEVTESLEESYPNRDGDSDTLQFGDLSTLNSDFTLPSYSADVDLSILDTYTSIFTINNSLQPKK